jgi:PAS domain-containing protein
MIATEPLPLHHSWPLFEQPRHFELGSVLNCVVTDAIEPPDVGALGSQHAGCWECDLSNNGLIWSGGVYDLFGLPRGVPICREELAGFYCAGSRDAMERLRAYSIRHARGFTLDAEIRPAIGGRRWMRLICAPVIEENRVVRLHGLKLAL